MKHTNTYGAIGHQHRIRNFGMRMMRYVLVAGTALSLAAAANDPAKNPSNRGERRPMAWGDLQKEFANPDMIYAPFIFWFWDEPLKPEKMAEMARVMGSEGFNPGYAHGRDSMVGMPDLPDDEWLGEKWFSTFGAALNEAEKQKCYLGYCDEYWWPSFQAHGRVLKQHPELKAESLNWQLTDAIGGTDVPVPGAACTRPRTSGKKAFPCKSIPSATP